MNKVIDESYFRETIECPECGQTVNSLYEVESDAGPNVLMCDYCVDDD